MLKYSESHTKVTYSEVPDEITLCISITGCKQHCEGCHSPELWKDDGEPLYLYTLETLIRKNKGISCVCLLGGDEEPDIINILLMRIKNEGLKTCWYSGKEKLSPDVNLINLDYLKLGSYKKELGGLASKTTNQRFYKVENNKLIDITSKFWKK